MSDKAQEQGLKKKVKAPRSGATGTSGRNGGIIDGAALLPQVNLLPASVRAKRALQRVKVWLVIGLGVVLLVALLAYVFAMTSASSAEEELDDVRADTQRLLNEQAKYAEVPIVLGQIEAAKTAEMIGMGYEVLWAEHFIAAIAALPEDAQLGAMSTASITPLLAAPLPADPMVTPGLGTVSFTHRSPSVGDLSAWTKALEEVPGFADVQYTTAAITDDDGDVFYEVVTTAQVTQEALSGRFGAEEEEL